jgi:hypothetical protein
MAVEIGALFPSSFYVRGTHRRSSCAPDLVIRRAANNKRDI